MKKVCCLIIALITIIMSFSACAKDEGKVSEAAETIIRAMTEYPNEELYNEEAISKIGLGIENQGGEGNVISNWNERVGEYFGSGWFEDFINQGTAFIYLSTADALEQTMELKEIILESRDEKTEVVLTTLLIDGEENQIRFTFTYDDGLVRTVLPEKIK